ncbi:MAG TPA: hypothetical protein VHO95_13150 [Candidatus Dormibacteraeota bacterium]|nr:hypothetical protein [Candidatus Dormibacteraeota bacterium]HEX2680248.1 hypothetical protein [Candidatus Dormibacteraeota bacterium]
MAVTVGELVESHPAIVPVLKGPARILWGKDIAREIPLPDIDHYTKDVIKLAVTCMAKLRQVTQVASPLQYPDPTGDFYGYDASLGRRAAGAEQPLRGLVATTSWITIAVVAVQAGKLCASREEHQRLYRLETDATWWELLARLDKRCRRDWRYELPTEAEERAELRDICGQALAFEWYALRIFEDWPLGTSRPAD